MRIKKFISPVLAVISLTVILTACADKKEKKQEKNDAFREDLKVRIEQADSLITENRLLEGNRRIYNMNPDLSARRDSIAIVLDAAREVLDADKGGYKVALDGVDSIYVEIEQLILDVEAARAHKESGTGATRTGGMRTTRQVSRQSTTSSGGQAVETPTRTGKRQPGSRLKNR